VQGIEHGEFAQQKIDATIAELRSERDTVKDLLPG
jgi:malate dehydrogenase